MSARTPSLWQEPWTVKHPRWTMAVLLTARIMVAFVLSRVMPAMLAYLAGTAFVGRWLAPLFSERGPMCPLCGHGHPQDHPLLRQGRRALLESGLGITTMPVFGAMELAVVLSHKPFEGSYLSASGWHARVFDDHDKALRLAPSLGGFDGRLRMKCNGPLLVAVHEHESCMVPFWCPPLYPGREGNLTTRLTAGVITHADLGFTHLRRALVHVVALAVVTAGHRVGMPLVALFPIVGVMEVAGVGLLGLLVRRPGERETWDGDSEPAPILHIPRGYAAPTERPRVTDPNVN